MSFLATLSTQVEREPWPTIFSSLDRCFIEWPLMPFVSIPALVLAMILAGLVVVLPRAGALRALAATLAFGLAGLWLFLIANDWGPCFVAGVGLVHTALLLVAEILFVACSASLGPLGRGKTMPEAHTTKPSVAPRR